MGELYTPLGSALGLCSLGFQLGYARENSDANVYCICLFTLRLRETLPAGELCCGSNRLVQGAGLESSFGFTQQLH